MTVTLDRGGVGQLVTCRQELAASEAKTGPGEEQFISLIRKSTGEIDYINSYPHF